MQRSLPGKTDGKNQEKAPTTHGISKNALVNKLDVENLWGNWKMICKWWLFHIELLVRGNWQNIDQYWMNMGGVSSSSINRE